MSYWESKMAFLPWNEMWWGNSFAEYILAMVLFIGFVLVFGLVQKIVLSRLRSLVKRTETDIDDTLVSVISSLKPPFYIFLSFYFAISSLVISGMAESIVDAILVIWITYQVVVATQIFLERMVEKKFVSGRDAARKNAVRMIANIGKGVLWGLGILVALSNVGVDITSLVAGLGIGGIAVAFALQNILQDLFSSFTIYFDKPFEPGDFIVAGTSVGTVKHIGIKSTRIKSLQGEEIIISNKELTSATIQNFKKMEKRRVVFTFGVLYETKTEQLKKIPAIFADIFSHIEKAELDRVHFSSFDDSALSFEVVYYVLDGDYKLYMDIRQEMNYALKDAFEKEGISLAYPTRTVYVKQ
jgi:small-conductance mechanosensitive channel